MCKSQLEPIIESTGNTRGAEQAFGRWFADGLYRGLVSSATQASLWRTLHLFGVHAASFWVERWGGGVKEKRVDEMWGRGRYMLGDFIYSQVTVEAFLTWKIYFPSCSGGPDFTPSLHHSFTPSLPVRHFETMLDWKFKFNSYRRLSGRCLSFIIPLKDTTLNEIVSITSSCSIEGTRGHLQTRFA